MKRRRLSAPGSACLTAVMLAIALPAASQGFGTITPGGVQPNIDRRLPLKETEQPDYEIPALPERPLDEDAGPRLKVRRFQLEGVEDIAGTPLSQRDINRQLEQIRREHPQGFTIGELQAVANQVTQFYRQNGFILALAILPEQDIKEGTVTITVLMGNLGQLSTANNTRYDDVLLKRPLVGLIGKPVQDSEVENALLRLNDLPGLEAAGIFRPGQDIGETELVINTIKEDALEYVLIADNYGVESTGTQRLIGGVTWNNPLGTGDKLSLNVLQTFDPEDSVFGVVNYETRVMAPELLAGFSYSVNNYNISQSIAFIDTDGETRIASIYGKYLHTRSRKFNLTGVVDLSTKHAEVDGLVSGEDKLTVLSVGLELDGVDGWMGGGISKANLFYSQGISDFLGSMDRDDDGQALRLSSNGERVGGDFKKLAFSWERLQLLDPNSVLNLRLQGQFSDDLLSSIEQYSMGGPNSVRAYPVAEYVRDKAVFASVEWIIDAPGFSSKPAFNGRSWGEVLSVSLFFDFAEGRRNDPLFFENKTETIHGVGLGIQFKPIDTAFFKFETATPTSSQDPSNGDDPQFWISVGIEL